MGGKQKSHSCAREADPTLPAPHESPRPSQRVAIDSRFKRQAEEVDRRGAGAHLLLVATKFNAVVALQGVATTYHNALKVSQSIVCAVRLATMSISIARWSRLG